MSPTLLRFNEQQKIVHFHHSQVTFIQVSIHHFSWQTTKCICCFYRFDNAKHIKSSAIYLNFFCNPFWVKSWNTWQMSCFFDHSIQMYWRWHFHVSSKLILWPNNGPARMLLLDSSRDIRHIYHAYSQCHYLSSDKTWSCYQFVSPFRVNHKLSLHKPYNSVSLFYLVFNLSQKLFKAVSNLNRYIKI